jgi:hypothetical protein
LTRQRTMLTQLISALDQAHGLVRLLPDDARSSREFILDFVEKAQKLCSQAAEQEKSCLQEVISVSSSGSRFGLS